MDDFMKKIEDLLELGGTKKDITFLIIGGISLVISIFHLIPLPFDAAWIAIILCGLPIILEAIVGLVTAFDIKADVLVSIALIASVIIGETFAAGEVAFIMQLGGLLEELTVARARAGIEKLVKLTPTTARVIRDGVESVIDAKDVRQGDILRVLPGETIAVDGIILSGNTSIDQSVMTGESLPVDKSEGDEVFSGTVNQYGAFEMKATKVGEDSSIQRMVQLVQSADAGKAEIVNLADRWATWIVVTALSAAVLTFIFTHKILRSVTILVVFCPCALVLATPTAIMAAIGNVTKHGFLVREGDALERLVMVSKICFDKTGTLTSGIPKVVAMQVMDSSYTEDQMYAYAAIAEKNSEHPLGKAVVRSYKERNYNSPDSPDSFEMVPGRGVIARANGREIMAGNLAMLEERSIDTSLLLSESEKYLDEGSTIIYVCIDEKPAAIIALADTLRENVKGTMSEILDMGVSPVLLTGDHEKAANHIANQLGIRKVISECLPQDKLNYIDESQKAGHKICMIGDGVNDAPSLKKSFVGLAMGGVGSDIAVDAADIVLVNDDISELPHLLALSKKMMFTIKCNLTFSMTLNLVAIILAITGILNPVAGALVHNSGSVLVIINSALLLGWKKNNGTVRQPLESKKNNELIRQSSKKKIVLPENPL